MTEISNDKSLQEIPHAEAVVFTRHKTCYEKLCPGVDYMHMLITCTCIASSILYMYSVLNVVSNTVQANPENSVMSFPIKVQLHCMLCWY